MHKTFADILKKEVNKFKTFKILKKLKNIHSVATQTEPNMCKSFNNNDLIKLKLEFKHYRDVIEKQNQEIYDLKFEIKHLRDVIVEQNHVNEKQYQEFKIIFDEQNQKLAQMNNILKQLISNQYKINESNFLSQLMNLETIFGIWLSRSNKLNVFSLLIM
jgi:hypothetical protein